MVDAFASSWQAFAVDGAADAFAAAVDVVGALFAEALEAQRSEPETL